MLRKLVGLVVEGNSQSKVVAAEAAMQAVVATAEVAMITAVVVDIR